MGDKMRNLWTRTISGFVLLGVVLVAILWSKWSFVILLAAIILGGLREFYRMANKAGYAPQKWLGMVSGILLLGIAFWLMRTMHVHPLASWNTAVLDAAQPLMILGIFLYVTLIMPIMLIYELFRKSATPIANVGTTLMGVIYVAVPLSMLLFIPLLLSEGEWNPLIVLSYIFIIWANDVFAYLFGITFGRHRLFERISPKKSWEGFVGGLLGAMIMGYLAALWLDGDMIKWIGMALIAAIAGVFGDLVESLFKRSIDMKDSGHIMPGHGGWLDRFDALILSIPFSFIYLVCCELFFR